MWLNDDPKYDAWCPRGRAPACSFIGAFSQTVPMSDQVQGCIRIADFHRCSCMGRKALLCMSTNGAVCLSEEELDGINYQKMVQQEPSFDGRVMLLKQLRMLDMSGAIGDGYVVLDGFIRVGEPYLLTSPILQPYERSVFDHTMRMLASGFSQGADSASISERLRSHLPQVATRQGIFTRWNGGSFDLEATDRQFAGSNVLARG